MKSIYTYKVVELFECLQNSFNWMCFNVTLLSQSNILCRRVCSPAVIWAAPYRSTSRWEARLASRLLGFIRRGLFMFYRCHCPDEALYLYTPRPHRFTFMKQITSAGLFSSGFPARKWLTVNRQNNKIQTLRITYILNLWGTLSKEALIVGLIFNALPRSLSTVTRMLLSLKHTVTLLNWVEPSVCVFFWGSQ